MSEVFAWVMCFVGAWLLGWGMHGLVSSVRHANELGQLRADIARLRALNKLHAAERGVGDE